MKMSEHAQRRSRQRAISEECLDLVLTFGSMKYGPGNAQIYFLDKKGYRKIEKILKQGPQLLEKIDKHVVVIDKNSEIITCYHRTKRFKD